ncbi:hypothetical protein BpHYR1_025506 [Brachionus plicatilis]|uniref:Uncharacterized protein n=1 Tax=Brachionus plicatilis TaxID=10195 RepID=A0A3M7RBA6_BRAPC|nr:hypothetical protein BpHYR1_025506 [Brachionus plicatilis]
MLTIQIISVINFITTGDEKNISIFIMKDINNILYSIEKLKTIRKILSVYLCYLVQLRLADESYKEDFFRRLQWLPYWLFKFFQFKFLINQKKDQILLFPLRLKILNLVPISSFIKRFFLIRIYIFINYLRLIGNSFFSIKIFKITETDTDKSLIINFRLYERFLIERLKFDQKFYVTKNKRNSDLMLLIR